MSKTLNIYLKRYFRYVQYFLTWLILEKPRGLDFSMRARSIGISSKGSHGYALTSRKAVKNILRGLPIGAGDRFLDIGCGKGGAMCFAAEFPFGRIAGIEIEPQLVDTARQNLEVLRLRDRVEVIHADALTFEHYDEFNFFFLFNPFDLEIYGAVLARIFRCLGAHSDGDRTIWLLCYGESNALAIESSNLFDLYRDETCPYRGNTLRVWRSKPGVGRVQQSGARPSAQSGVAGRLEQPVGGPLRRGGLDDIDRLSSTSHPGDAAKCR